MMRTMFWLKGSIGILLAVLFLALNVPASADSAEALHEKILDKMENQAWQEALPIIEETIDLGGTPSDLAALYSLKGVCLSWMMHYEDALPEFDRASLLDSADFTAYGLKGGCLYKLGRYGEALEAFDTAVLDPDAEAALFNLRGWCLFNLGYFDEALENFDITLLKDDTEVEFYNSKALCLYYMQQYPEAIAIYDRSLALKSDNVDAAIGKGLCLDSLGDYEGAQEIFSFVLGTDTTYQYMIPSQYRSLAMIFKIDEPSYRIGNQVFFMDTAPYIDRNGRAMIPIRNIAHAIGIEDSGIIWDPAAQSASLTMDGNTITFPVGRNYCVIQDNQHPLDTAAVIKDGHIMLPIRSAAMAFAKSVTYDPELKTIHIE